MTEKPKPYKHQNGRNCVPTDPKKRRWIFWGIPIGLILVAGIAVAVVVTVSKQKQAASGGTGSGSGSANGTTTRTGSGTAKSTKTGSATNAAKPSATVITTNFGVAGNGADGSTVTTDLGAQFTYTNGFGGTWAQDPENPYNVSLPYAATPRTSFCFWV